MLRLNALMTCTKKIYEDNSKTDAETFSTSFENNKIRMHHSCGKAALHLNLPSCTSLGIGQSIILGTRSPAHSLMIYSTI